MIGEPEIAGLASRMAFGEIAGIVISVLISFALFSSLSAFILLGARVYYSTAKQGYFFKMFAKVNPKTRVPLNAIFLQSKIAIILVLSGTFEQILVNMGFSLGIFPIQAVLGVFKIRRSKISKLKLPGYPYVHLFFIVTGFFLIGFCFSITSL